MVSESPHVSVGVEGLFRRALKLVEDFRPASGADWDLTFESDPSPYPASPLYAQRTLRLAACI